MLTISRLSRWSINYYNDTAREASEGAMDRQRANGGLGEYYSDGDTRTPTCNRFEPAKRADDPAPCWCSSGICHGFVTLMVLERLG